jgi:diguanylate cyclase (GGDEF)-like protein
MPFAARYVLIAISNLSRGASLKRLASETARIEVVLVRDGDAALHEITERGAPVLLVVDPSLPRVDGFTIIRNVRRQPTAVRTRIVVVSAHDSLRSAARELSSSLEIAAVLPLDADAKTLEDALNIAPEGAREARSEPAVPAALPTQDRAVDADEVIDRAAVDVRRQFRMPAAVGYLKLGDDENLMLHVSTANPQSKMAMGDVDFSLLRQVAEGSEPIVIPNVESHAVFSRLTAKGGHPVRAFAAVPVTTTRTNARAALCILDTDPLKLSAADIDAFAAFGRHVGQELDRVLIQTDDIPAAPDLKEVDELEALQQLAATDPLTNLANRRGGEKHIANEVSRARREKRPLSCILIDIDRFKQVNDTFGHQAGDQLLRDVSALLRSTVRAYDILVRWGGDEFLVVLPGVDLDVARVLAERIRGAVEMLDTHGIGAVTISAGASSFEKDYDFMATLKVADRRLYQAKAAGRNCSV